MVTLFSLGLILLLGFIIGSLLNKIKIPGLVGMILIGLLFGPFALNLISEDILNISSTLRQIALVIILTRSGLNLDLASLKKVGRPAILMCFIPATIEIIGVMLASYFLLHLSFIEGLLLGSVLAAVSPAVVSPRMINLIEKRFGEDKQIPKLVLAGSSVDDIYVIVLFYAFLGLNKTNEFNALKLLNIPLSIVLGIIIGLLVGFALVYIFKKLKTPTLANVIITFATSLMLVGVEKIIESYISFSSLLSIIIIGIILLFKNEKEAKEMAKSYNSMWKVFEVILFVLVGASLNISYALDNFLLSLLVLLIGLVFRSIGVLLCLIKSDLNIKERLFVIFAYLPKATVQASIGAIALNEGLPSGAIILTVSVISIIITAPIGAFLIDNTSKLLLENNNITKKDLI